MRKIVALFYDWYSLSPKIMARLLRTFPICPSYLRFILEDQASGLSITIDLILSVILRRKYIEYHDLFPSLSFSPTGVDEGHPFEAVGPEKLLPETLLPLPKSLVQNNISVSITIQNLHNDSFPLPGTKFPGESQCLPTELYINTTTSQSEHKAVIPTLNKFRSDHYVLQR